MSNVITSQCWPLRMPPTAKAVLISLADQASDSGQCWPSITTICERTCFGRTAVIDAIAWLEEAGALTANRANGRHTTYCVTPEKYAEPVREANLSAKQTGPAGALEPVRLADNQSGRRTTPVRQADTNHKEPSLKAIIKEPPKDEVAELLADIPAELLADFKQIRKAKKAPLTATAVKGLIRECRNAGITLRAGIEMCCERGWSAVKADWLNKPTIGARNETHRNLSAVERVRESAIRGELADRAARQPNGHADLVGQDGGDLRTPLDLVLWGGGEPGGGGGHLG